MIEDITGTTVYVIGIIAVIPAIGLLAWFVRFAVRRKVRKDLIDYENTLKPLKMDRIFLENEIKLLDKIQEGTETRVTNTISSISPALEI